MSNSLKHTFKKRMPRLVPLARASRAWLAAFGLEPIKFLAALRFLPSLLREYRALQRQNRATDQPWSLHLSLPCLGERQAESGCAAGHYFHQDLLVARRIFARNPRHHIDVGSRVDGFVAHVATFRPIEVLDIRPLPVRIPNVTFSQCDLMQLPSGRLGACDSLSCLHALEHFGLGRYGDPITLHGYRQGLENLGRLVAPGGWLYLSVPVGRQRIEFNAHRVFAPQTILELMSHAWELVDFSYVDDGGALHESTGLPAELCQDLARMENGCGIFEFRKNNPATS